MSVNTLPENQENRKILCKNLIPPSFEYLTLIPSLARLKLNALITNHVLEWAEVTHPFHPLRGQKFQILKKKKIGNVEILFLKGTYKGTFGLPKEYTDQAEPSIYSILGIEIPLLETKCLTDILDILKNLNCSDKRKDKK